MGDPVPERLDAMQAVGFMVARDQGRVDRADRGADDPVRHQVMFVQGLVDPGLVGAQRAAALQHQHDAQLVRIE